MSSRPPPPPDWLSMFPASRHLHVQLVNLERHLMSQIDDLRQAVAQVGVDLGEAVDRVEARLAETEVDLSPEIASLRSASETLDSIAAEEPAPGEGGEHPDNTLPGEELPFDPNA